MKRKADHHRGSYHRRSLACVQAAYADPTTKCGKCGLTLAEHDTTRSGKPPRWSAGHVTDGQVNGPLQPEVLSCNSSAGARLRHRIRTDLTW